MRNTIAYYLLILYSLAVFKPVLPILKDEIAHFFLESYHIATVHQHHGDHHTEAEIAHSAHEDENDKTPATTKGSEPVSQHIVVNGSFAIQPSFSQLQLYGTNQYTIACLWLDKKYPPPRFC